MAPNPLVSIITPSFNQAPFLEATIKSVLDQEHPNIEYIVIDGGSTDGCVNILEKYSDRLDYWISEPDAGQTDAINKGFNMAKGEIFWYMGMPTLSTTRGSGLAGFQQQRRIMYDCVRDTFTYPNNRLSFAVDYGNKLGH